MLTIFDLADFEQSEMLNKLGFDEPTLFYYNEEHDLCERSVQADFYDDYPFGIEAGTIAWCNDSNSILYNVPSLYEAHKFVYSQYGLFVIVQMTVADREPSKFYWKINDSTGRQIDDDNCENTQDSYFDALSNGLTYAMRILLKNKKVDNDD